MPHGALTTGAVLIVSLLALAACNFGQVQARTDGYGAAYTQFGRD